MEQTYARLLQLASLLEFQLAPDKCSLPVTSLVWLSFKVDMVPMTVSVPQEKISEILDECKMWESKSRASHKQLQSVAGKIQLSKCMKPASRFLNRVLAALRATPFPDNIKPL